MAEMKSKATWIWYPGDFEVWLGNKFNNRRTERGVFFPPFWKQDSHWPTVVFTKNIVLTETETIAVVAEGQYSLSIDGKLQGGLRGVPPPLTPPLEGAGNGCALSAASPLPCRGGAGGGVSNFTIPQGTHTLTVKVWNQATPPALFIDSSTVKTDGSWLVTYEDKIWIDENGVAHGSGIYVPVGHASERADGRAVATLGGVDHYGFDSPETPPSRFHLPTKPLRPVCCGNSTTNGALYDFGRETFGYLRIHGLRGTVRVYYGESREEALDREHCETLDVLTDLHEVTPYSSKAFRFVLIEREGDASYDDVTMDYEYAPYDERHSGSFRCNDEELNKIWEVAAYTLELTTREFFCDGIKRDRWTWSGDAIQSYLMNYYLHFDTECVKRTIRQLRGKDPVTAHVNTIMDYTFYWIKSILDYYQYTGDEAFVREMWPKMVTLMDFVLSRTNADGMAKGRPDDWIFVDWTDFPMHKRGTLCFEQILFLKALETMLFFAQRFSLPCSLSSNTADALCERIQKTFWSNERHAFLHAIEDGEMNTQVTKFPNMFAILYGMATDEQQRQIMQHVMRNPAVPAITTPYMRFYELETLCQMGQQDAVFNEIKSYWGGMLREGATTFWEKYNPEEKGIEHLAMYGRPYGKSLCHAWGASPLYLLGRYFLGVRPTKPGYEEFEVRPALGGLQWMEGDVPTPLGMIHVSMNKEEVTVSSDFPGGTLVVKGKEYPIVANRTNTVKL